MDAERLSALETQLRSVQARLREIDAGGAAQSRRDLYRMSMLGVEHMRDDFVTQLKHYKNLIWNSSFEVLEGAGPANWTAGAQSADASWEGTYSLKLTPGQVAAQAPAAWISPAWYGGGTTRVAFLYKFGGGTCQVLNEAGVVLYTETMEFAQDWPPGRVQFVFDPGDAAQVYLQFTNTSSSEDMYVDAVQLEPDLSGKWASLYSDGPFSAAGGGGPAQPQKGLPDAYVVAAYDTIDQSRADFVCDGLSDEVEIQLALNTAANDRRRVLLLAGTYQVGDTIVVPDNSNQITLEGQGAGTHILCYDATRGTPDVDLSVEAGSSSITAGFKAYVAVFRDSHGNGYPSPVVSRTLTAGQQLRVRDITNVGLSPFQWPPPAPNQELVLYQRLSDGRYHLVEMPYNRTIHAPGQEMVIDSEATLSAPTYQDPHAYSGVECFQIGFGLAQSPITIRNLRINGNPVFTDAGAPIQPGLFQRAINVAFTRTVNIENVTVERNWWGITANQVQRLRISECDVRSVPSLAINVNSCNDCVLTNNHVSRSGEVRVNNGQRGRIANNYLTDSDGMVLTQTQRLMVSGNIFWDNGYPLAAASSQFAQFQIRTSQDNFNMITGNLVGRPGINPTRKALYGISELPDTAGGSGNWIALNQVIGSGTDGNVQVTSAVTFPGNRGVSF